MNTRGVPLIAIYILVKKYSTKEANNEHTVGLHVHGVWP